MPRWDCPPRNQQSALSSGVVRYDGVHSKSIDARGRHQASNGDSWVLSAFVTVCRYGPGERFPLHAHAHARTRKAQRRYGLTGLTGDVCAGDALLCVEGARGREPHGRWCVADAGEVAEDG